MLKKIIMIKRNSELIFENTANNKFNEVIKCKEVLEKKVTAGTIVLK